MTPEEFRRLRSDARPRLCWRIGITGHRTLDPQELPRIRTALGDIFDAVENALADAQKPQVDANDKKETNFFSDLKPLIAVVSPLAEGADRLVAELAVERGHELRAPLPFPVDEYKKDFPKTVAEFDRLLAYARETRGGVAELAGVPRSDDARNLAYLGVGEFVLANCDFLIVIWNAAPAAGVGGTQQIVDLAHQSGVTIIHIHSKPTTEQERALRIAQPPGSLGWRPFNADDLTKTIRDQIIPFVRVPPAPHGRKKAKIDGNHGPSKQPPSLRRGEACFAGEPVTENLMTQPDFLYEGPFAPDLPKWMQYLAEIFPWFVRTFGGKISVRKPRKADPPCGKCDPPSRFLFLHHQRVDRLALFYSDVHRSTFLLVYPLGAIALTLAVAALEFHDWKAPLTGMKGVYFFTGLELLVLLLLAALVHVDNSRHWRDRWLEYRLLAELLREADLLAQIGRPMPIAKIDELAQDLPGRAWVMVAYCALIRRAGIVSRKFDPAFLEDIRNYAVDPRFQDQIAYHERTEARSESIGGNLRFIGTIAFVLTIAVAIAKLASGLAIWKFGHAPWVEWVEAAHLGLFAGMLPASAYALFGIRNQAEFEIVSRRSERMIAKLSLHQDRASKLVGPALTANALAAEVLSAADVMRHDAVDWTSIFEVKDTETT